MNRAKVFLAHVAAVVTLFLTIPTVYAGTISPTDISSSTSSDYFSVDNLISSLGLTGSDPQMHYYYDFGFPVTRRNLWVTETVGERQNRNYFDHRASPVLTMDLGTDYNLDAVYLWAYAFGTDDSNAYQGNSVREFELIFNTEAEGIVFYGAAELSATMTHGKILPTGRPNFSDTEPRQDFPLPIPVRARYIQMNILSNYHNFDSHVKGGDRVGLSEIQFSGTAVPEPSSLLLLVLGAVVVAACGRRRR